MRFIQWFMQLFIVPPKSKQKRACLACGCIGDYNDTSWHCSVASIGRNIIEDDFCPDCKIMIIEKYGEDILTPVVTSK